MVRLHHCVSVTCDQCGDPHPGHFPTEDTALDVVALCGWYVRDDGRVWCPACGPVLTCEATGHEFTDWQGCQCQQSTPSHPAGPGTSCGRAHRYCMGCLLHESCVWMAVA